MSKVFISTANCGKAHDLDIFGLALSAKYTITCSGDGTIKLWNNRLLDGESPKDHFTAFTIDASGVQTVGSFDTEFGTIIACVSFSGKLSFHVVEASSESLSLKPLSLLSREEEQRSYWAIKWSKSADRTVSHRFVATTVQGSTYVWKFDITGGEDQDSIFNPKLSLQGEITVKDPVFATSVDISSEKGLIATGFANGSVTVSEVRTLKPLYNFQGFGMQGAEQNSNTVRRVRFSPLGTVLAVANDSGSYGCVTLYETEFGERVSQLTVPTHSNQTTIGTYAHNGWVLDLDFSPSGEFLATCGYDAKVRIWEIKSKEHVATLHMNANDIENEEDIMKEDENGDPLTYPPVFGVKYIKKGIRSGMGSENNDGLCCICMDRSIRWYREAGGA